MVVARQALALIFRAYGDISHVIDYNAIFRNGVTMGEHPSIATPSAWVQRWAPLVPAGGAVLDVACGGGRHALFFAGRGHPVAAVDRDPAAVAALAGQSAITALCADIENGPWPYAGQQFAAIVVTNYPQIGRAHV